MDDKPHDIDIRPVFSPKLLVRFDMDDLLSIKLDMSHKMIEYVQNVNGERWICESTSTAQFKMKNKHANAR